MAGSVVNCNLDELNILLAGRAGLLHNSTIKNCMRAGHPCGRVVENESNSCGLLLLLAGSVWLPIYN